MRRVGRLALACCCLPAALAPEAQAQEAPPMAGDTTVREEPFETCDRLANWIGERPHGHWENPEYMWWERCMDEVSRGGPGGRIALYGRDSGDSGGFRGP